jgi:Domain of unknown function (DUF4912)
MKLTQTELLEISQEISKSFMPKISNDLPKLTLMSVAPLHLYAYWNLGSHKSVPQQKNNTQELTLRIYSEADKNNYLSKGYEEFPINRTNPQQDIFLAMPSDTNSYRASLGTDNHQDVIADSNFAQLPLAQTPVFQLKADSPSFTKPSYKEIKISAYHNNSGLGIK